MCEICRSDMRFELEGAIWNSEYPDMIVEKFGVDLKEILRHMKHMKGCDETYKSKAINAYSDWSKSQDELRVKRNVLIQRNSFDQLRTKTAYELYGYVLPLIISRLKEALQDDDNVMTVQQLAQLLNAATSTAEALAKNTIGVVEEKTNPSRGKSFEIPSMKETLNNLVKLSRG